ncbi:MAG: DUF4350 domain-containing protein [Myxococcales bacterium]|nr:DUF4350 domain-containing protein [Myxococcales bacterium]
MRFGLAHLALGGAVICGTAGIASAAAFELNDGSWEGCRELLELARNELGAERVVVVGTLDWETISKEDGVLVLHPANVMDVEEVAAFMKAGGRFAIADDHGRGDRVLSHFKIHRRALPAYPERFLRGNRAVAIAVPARDVTLRPGAAVHPTVADAHQVVVNHAMGLVHPDLTPVLEVRGTRDVTGMEPDTASVAVAGQVELGRLFALGDPSSFINLMLRYPGNRAFARGLVRYLADGDATDLRKGKLYLVANDFSERGSFGGTTPLRKELERRVRALAAGLRELRDGGFPWWLHVAVAGLCALAVMRWAAATLFRAYVARRPRYATETPMVQQAGMAGRRAVLASRSSAPALALLELKSAFVEVHGPEVGLGAASAPSEILERLRAQRGLDEGVVRRAGAVLQRMRRAEDDLLSGAVPAVTREQVSEASEALAALNQAARG